MNNNIKKIKDIRFKLYKVYDDNNIRNYSFFIERILPDSDIINFIEYMKNFSKTEKTKVNILTKNGALYAYANLSKRKKPNIIFTHFLE
jgi:hypothetical protein